MQIPLKALIFDFDGLMIDTESPAFHAWAAIYREHGVELRLEHWVECVGSSDSRFDPVTHLAELVGPSRGGGLDRVALFADKERRKAFECDRLSLLPGVDALLISARTRGLKLAVASSSSRSWVEGHLSRLARLDLFDAVRTREDVVRTKPAPDLYIAAAAALSVPPAACLVLEDSLNGVRAAKAAGMRCYAVPNFVTRGLDFAEADAIYSSLEHVRLEPTETRS